ncbi:hypothetical protein FISHEDRAFT_53171 [Fistulina hepatica ATCC 64428]|nr:hypothetical protein FISHEDRAFT_53171 [Fistulina hepatica ATCC 64428]
MIRHDSNRTTHIFAYSLSLLGANLVQSISSLLSVEWILRGKVFVGAYCDVQGEQLFYSENLPSLTTSLIISLHLFNLLFLRRSSDQTSTWSEITKWGTTVLGWALPVVLVAIGPAVVAKPEKGPFFGLSGYCCWISSEYREALIYLEFMLEYTAMILALLLSIIVLLRVRGNLVEHDRGWYLRKVPTEEKWALTVARDLVDRAMLLVAQVNVWCVKVKVAYTLLMIPITIVRILDVTGSPVPFWAVVMANVIFNLNGTLRLHASSCCFRSLMFNSPQVLPMFSCFS